MLSLHFQADEKIGAYKTVKRLKMMPVIGKIKDTKIMETKARNPTTTDKTQITLAQPLSLGYMGPQRNPKRSSS